MSAPAPVVDAHGFVNVVVFYERPASPPGNYVVRICPTCLGRPDTGHKPDCAWRKSASATQASPVKLVDLSSVMGDGSDSRPFLLKKKFTNLVLRQQSNQYSCEAPPETTRISHPTKGYTSYFISEVHEFDVVWNRPNNAIRCIRPMQHR